jgi:mono/diheme cytochrome c family protein
MTSRKVFLIILLSVFIFYCPHAQAVENPSLADGEKIYQWYCTPCHGIKGDGKGFNAKNLDPRPAVHSDPEFMSKKTDNDIYDAISGGGKAVGKATLMPPWGNTFNENQIKSLILYLRELCRCQGE